ncbi:MAG TPA: DUF1905 domain-containing protein [Solirubrobacter sp.]|nr:DUF1905 domain-containing protein [Solirubrobacter sp.]
MTFTAELWRHAGQGGWHFVTLPHDVADEVRARSLPRRGFGSVRVRATLGATSWETSVFPDAKTSSYLLPVKGDVRQRERVRDGDTVTISLALV